MLRPAYESRFSANHRRTRQRHPAVEDAELHHRFQLFGDHGGAGIDPQLLRRHPVEDNRVLRILRRGRDGVAEADVDLHRTARAIEQTHHRDANARIVSLLADFGDLYTVGLKHDPVVTGDLADLAEQVFQIRNVGGAKA